MLAPAVHAARRAQLAQSIGRPVLLVGNGHRARNLPMNGLPFRQDSTFLYYTGCTEPGAAMLLTRSGAVLFLDPPADDDALWHGKSVGIEARANALGFDAVRPSDSLDTAVADLPQVPLSLAVADHARNAISARLSGATLRFGEQPGPSALVDAVIHQRRSLSPIERDEMRAAGVVTARAHRAAMAATRPGGNERQIAALFRATLEVAGMCEAYPSIVTVDGEVLHNFHAHNPLTAGRLLLLDGGAEAPTGYATDVTRTWPVDGVFSPRQRAAYEAVLAAQDAAIARVQPGTRYRSVHDAASLTLARFLVDEGLVRGTPEDAVAQGAHAVFFPHGVGHLIGLDVHDMEDFGDRPSYPDGRQRSEQFGTGYLRLDIDLAPGMVVTVEPGFYVVPAILNDPTLRARFAKIVDFDAAATWVGFGGIRIEDDIAVTESGHENLTPNIPRTVAEIEAIVGTGDLTIPLG